MKISKEQAKEMLDTVRWTKDGYSITDTFRIWQKHDWIEKSALEEYQECYQEYMQCLTVISRVDLCKLYNLGMKAIEEEKAKNE